MVQMEYSVLNVVNRLRLRIRDEESRLKRLREMQTSMVKEMDGMPRGHVVNSRLEKMVVAITALENTIATLKVVKRECAGELWRLLDALIIEQTTFQVMYRRYVKCKRFRDIGLELGYSERRVYQLHRQGMLILGVHG